MKNSGFISQSKAFIKRNRFIYRVYFYVMSLGVNLLKLFLKSDDKLILFVSFGGRKCTDSPRAIYDYMLKDPRFKDYKLVWGVINPSDFPELKNTVKMDTLSYFKTAIKSRCWITNVLVERAINFKGINTFYLYTGHGSPIKKDGPDYKTPNRFIYLGKFHYNASLAQSELERDVRSRAFNLSLPKVYMTGTPTNDILTCYTIEDRNKIREELGIPQSKKAILYAPTFREYNSIGTFETKIVDFEKWHRFLGDDYVILYRAHPISISKQKETERWFVDATNYNRIEPLMIASDMLVSDYSGLIPDYSIMHKPIYLWTYDYDQYEKARGLYFDIRKVLPYAEKEEDLLQLIKNGYTDTQKDAVLKFQQKYAPVFGHGTENAVDLVWDKISDK